MSLPCVLLFSSLTLSMLNLNLCMGGVTSWKSSNSHFSYRANAGDSARQSVSTESGSCCLLLIYRHSTDGLGVGDGSLPWVSSFPNNFFFTQTNMVRWLKYHNKPGPVGWNVTAVQILTDEVMLEVTALHLVACGSICNFPSLREEMLLWQAHNANVFSVSQDQLSQAAERRSCVRFWAVGRRVERLSTDLLRSHPHRKTCRWRGPK